MSTTATTSAGLRASSVFSADYLAFAVVAATKPAANLSFCFQIHTAFSLNWII